MWKERWFGVVEALSRVWFAVGLGFLAAMAAVDLAGLSEVLATYPEHDEWAAWASGLTSIWLMVGALAWFVLPGGLLWGALAALRRLAFRDARLWTARWPAFWISLTAGGAGGVLLGTGLFY